MQATSEDLDALRATDEVKVSMRKPSAELVWSVLCCSRRLDAGKERRKRREESGEAREEKASNQARKTRRKCPPWRKTSKAK